jgi:uncharacterized protein (TIGR02118 family)
MIKMIGTAYKRDDFTTEEFFRYWRDVHAPITAKAPGIRGYVVSEVVRKFHGDLDVDGFVELWWDSEEALDEAMGSPEEETAWNDLPNYAKPTGTFWIAKEHVYIPPPITGPGSLSRQAWLA